MGYECFEVSRDDRVATKRLSRPERLNTMTREFWLDLPPIAPPIEP